MKSESLSYFLAANTGEGFKCLFNELYDPYDNWKLFIIKGGPGTGKSGIMKKIYNKAVEYGYCCHKVYCSSDPDSLDAVIIPEKKVSVCDGTSPHTMDPIYPGVSETIINLCDCWDDRKLKESREHILTLTDCNKALHKRSAKFLTAAAASQADNEKIIESCTDHKKAENYAVRSILKNISSKNKTGKEKMIFLNANTPKGKFMFYDTLSLMCDKIITITDEYKITSSYVIKKMADYAHLNGADVIICADPLRPSSSPLHLILPEERIGYFTSDSGLNLKHLATKNIYASRFINKERLSLYKNRLAFNQKTKEKFETEAINIMNKAKTVHDELEKYYVSAMDFDKLDKLTDSLIDKIFSF